MNTEFEKLIIKKCNKIYNDNIIGIVIFLVIFLFFAYWYIKMLFTPFLILSISILLFGIYITYKNRGGLKSSSFWVDKIKNHPDEIVWIKPIVTKHNIAFVFTIKEDQEYILFTNKGLKIPLLIKSKDDGIIFFKGVKENLPDAHIGFSYETETYYDYSPSNFLNLLKKNGLYTPVSNFNF